jgi:hypothetical protein
VGAFSGSRACGHASAIMSSSASVTGSRLRCARQMNCSVVTGRASPQMQTSPAAASDCARSSRSSARPSPAVTSERIVVSLSASMTVAGGERRADDAVLPRDRRDDPERELAERRARDLGVRQITVIERRVELVVPDLFERDAGELVAQLDLEQRIALDGAREKMGKPHELGIRHRSESHATRHLSRELAGLRAHRVDRGDHRVNDRQQSPASGRQRHPARQPLEQRNPQLVLERADLRGECGLAHVQFLRGAGQV